MTLGGGRFTEQALIGADLVFLLSIDYAGQTFRWASSQTDVASDDGTLHFGPMVEVDEIEQSFSFETDSPGTLEAVFNGLVFPVDVPLLEAQGHSLAAATGELSAHIVGQVWERRHVILKGELDDPTYGDPGEHPNAASFTLQNPGYSDSARFPAQTFTRAAFSTLDDKYVGLVFPFVFGFPGNTVKTWTASTASTAKSSPCIPIDSGFESIMVAGHDIQKLWYDPATADLDIYNATQDVTNSYQPQRTKNPITGVVYAAVDTSADVGFYVATDEYWVSGWGGDYAEPTMGAYPGIEDSDRSLHAAGDVLFYMLTQSSLEVDHGRLAVARQWLNRFDVHGYIDAQVSPYEWIVDNLAPLLPIAFQTGPLGVYPAVWAYEAIATDAVAHLVEGSDWVRVGPAETDTGSIVNRLTMEYAVDVDAGYLRTVTLDGSLDDLPDDGNADEYAAVKDWDNRPDHYARASYLRYGLRDGGTISSDIVQDNETAQKILSWKIRANAFPTVRVAFQAGVRHAWMEPGHVIAVTSPSMQWTEQIVIIEGKSWTLTGPRYILRMIPDPPRDARPI